MSTLILKVDLDCCSCYKKIRKILCKLQDQEGIRTISFDDGSNTIAVVGPFDPHRLSCKIRCKGGKVIKGIEIIQHNGGGGEQPERMAGAPPMKNGKKKKKGKPKEMDMEPHPPQVHEQPPQPPPPPPVENPPPPAQPAPPDSHISTVMPPTIEEQKQWERPAELEPVYEPFPPAPPVENERLHRPPARPVWPVDVKPSTVEIEIPSWPAPRQPIRTAGSSYGCSCCQPCYQGYYEGCRCCSCGRVYGYAVGVLPTPAGCYAGGASYRPGCQLFSEEDPAGACTVM
ncbi:unnamed protein product [Alopecurus aequalis]